MTYMQSDWSVAIGKEKRCDICGVPGRTVQAFTLVHTAYRAGKRQTKSAGGIHLCHRCWRVTGGLRRKPGKPRPELSADQLEAARMRREHRAQRATFGKDKSA